MIMFKIKVWFCLLLVIVSTGGIVAAQQPKGTTVLPAPVPVQILSAKKVFISNVPGETFFLIPHSGWSPWSARPLGVATAAADELYRPYNQFYAALKSWGYHEVVSAPADADLILEIRLRYGPVLYFEVTVRDPKTQVVLWWLAERLQEANRIDTGEKNYNLAMTNLVNDWKKLVGQPTATSDNYKK